MRLCADMCVFVWTTFSFCLVPHVVVCTTTACVVAVGCDECRQVHAEALKLCSKVVFQPADDSVGELDKRVGVLSYG